MDIQTAIDRITEIESLTDEMDDESADWIINWAIEKLKAALPQITDADQAAEKTDDVIGVVKQLNGITASIDRKKASALPLRVAQFAAAYQKAFGQAPPIDPARVASEIAPKSPREAMEHLLRAAAPPADTVDTADTANTADTADPTDMVDTANTADTTDPTDPCN